MNINDTKHFIFCQMFAETSFNLERSWQPEKKINKVKQGLLEGIKLC